MTILISEKTYDEQIRKRLREVNTELKREKKIRLRAREQSQRLREEIRQIEDEINKLKEGKS